MNLPVISLKNKDSFITFEILFYVIDNGSDLLFFFPGSRLNNISSAVQRQDQKIDRKAHHYDVDRGVRKNAVTQRENELKNEFERFYQNR